MVDTKTFSNLLRSLNSKKFKALWENQEHVLKRYLENYQDKSDVAIELPTGAGKTLIALLIAEKYRREGKKVAVLSANKTLARQLGNEANELGIPVVLLEGKGIEISSKDRRNYNRAKKIAVMNYWVYFNQNPVIDRADYLIMDDAHLAEHCLDSLWSVEIKKYEHEKLFISLTSELLDRFPEYKVLHDALDDNIIPDTPPELLSFIDQVKFESRLREIVENSKELKNDNDLKYRWHRLRQKLLEANIYLSLDSIWIRPYIYPLNMNIYYEDAIQRIYMSATIGDASDLSRRLGTRKIEKIPIDKKYSESTSGRRLIVMNSIDKSDIPERLEDAILASLKKIPKSIWICTSKVKAEKFKNAVSEWLDSNDIKGHQTWLLTSLGSEIEDFKRSEKGHLFVGGRYDGMDFQGDECRIVVLATLPQAINTQEQFICSYLRDSDFMMKRLNMRVIQALGRCNRASDDYAIYFLADRRFATYFGKESNKRSLSKNIIAEIDMAEDLTSIPIEALLGKVENFLDGDFSDYDSELKELLDEVPNNLENERNEKTTVDIIDSEVLAWTAMFDSQNYSMAAKHFENCFNKAKAAKKTTEISSYYGWCYAKALYLDDVVTKSGARGKALDILDDVVKRGGMSSWFNRIRASLNRERNERLAVDSNNNEQLFHSIKNAFDTKLEKVGKGTRFEPWINGVSERLQSKKHDTFLVGLEDLGQLLGYNTGRPKGSSATDCLWKGIFGNNREVLTIEAKIEHTPGVKIAAKDIGQAHNQLTRTKTEYGKLGYLIRGVIVTHLNELYPDAKSSLGEIRIISRDSIFELWKIVKNLLIEYRDNWSLDDIALRNKAAEGIKNKIPPSNWLVRAIDCDTHFVGKEILLKEWML